MAAKKKRSTTTAKKKVAKGRRTGRGAKAPAGGGGQLKALWAVAREAEWFGYWKPLALLAALVVAVVWVWKMEGVALQQRLARDIEANPTTAQWAAQQRELVGELGGLSAVWGGEVQEVVMSVPPRGGVSQPVKVLLRGAAVLAGGRGDKDDDPVVVYVLGFGFPGGVLPREGERWLFSVRRDDFGSNKVAAALRY